MINEEKHNADWKDWQVIRHTKYDSTEKGILAHQKAHAKAQRRRENRNKNQDLP
jgi:hypothetical protein